MEMEDDNDDNESDSSQPSGVSSQTQMVQQVSMVTAPSTASTPTTLMLVTSNVAGAEVGVQPAVAVRQGTAIVGQPGAPAAITLRSTANGIGAAGGLVVLSGTSVAGGTAPVHSGVVSTQGGLPNTLAVRTNTTANTNSSKTHTILVMPVSSTGAGDVSAVKRVKTE